MEYNKFKSVLLVDDSYVDNLINSKMLEASKFADTVTVMDSPSKAIAYIKESAKDGNLPEVLFLDIRMPEMDGFEFLETLNSIPEMHTAHVKIYMLSSSLDPDDIKLIGNNLLVAKFISKPLTEKILNSIEK
ncbi:MAG TPA: response regulator [Pedobacter sp.]|jgi:CheY-like chemotaxis protein